MCSPFKAAPIGFRGAGQVRAVPRLFACVLVAVMLCAVGLSCASRAAAQSPEVQERARALFEKGLAASDQERWGEAADLFARSRALLERPSTVLNLVGALYRLGRYRESLAAADDYLRLSDPVADAAKRKEVEGLRAAMQKAMGTAHIEVEPSDASLEIDGERFAVRVGGYRLQLDPGLHNLVARKAGYRDHRRGFDLESGATVDLRVVLEPEQEGHHEASLPASVGGAQATPVSTPPQAPQEKEKAPNKRLRRALWITGAVLVAGAAATAVVLARTRDKPDSGSTCSPDADPPCIPLN